MNLITDSLRGLVRRKLWPVALLLVGALVAVPVAASIQIALREYLDYRGIEPRPEPEDEPPPAPPPEAPEPAPA